MRCHTKDDTLMYELNPLGVCQESACPSEVLPPDGPLLLKNRMLLSCRASKRLQLPGICEYIASEGEVPVKLPCTESSA